MVDEAHHAGEEGYFPDLLAALPGRARPRADRHSLARRRVRHHRSFRQARFHDGHRRRDGGRIPGRRSTTASSSTSSIGKRYRRRARKGLTIKELNQRLFLPQRDEAVIEKLRDAWQGTIDPRAIVYCRTINHAEEFAQKLREAGWRRAACINAGQTNRERDLLMSSFRDGRIPILTAVDIFNEGVDVPDVNILCFLRVTHSRRIFVQQLGPRPSDLIRTKRRSRCSTSSRTCAVSRRRSTSSGRWTA